MDDAAAVLAKGIKAQGGPGMHDRWKRGYVRLLTTEGFLGPGIKATVEDTFDYPNRLKRRVEMSAGSETASFTCVIADGNSWMKPDGKETYSLGSPKNGPQENPLASFCAIPADVGKDASLTKLEDVRLGDQFGAAIRVESQKNGVTELVFDKHTGLLAKTIKHGVMPGSNKVSLIESNRENYRSLQGGMIPMKLTGFQDGKKILDIELVEVKFLESIPADTFAKP